MPKKRWNVFLSHAHQDRDLATYMDGLLRTRWGPQLCIFNTSKSPLPENRATTPDQRGTGGYDDLPDQRDDEATEGVAASTRSSYNTPGVYVEDVGGLLRDNVQEPLFTALAESHVVIVILTARSSTSNWVVWEAGNNPFEPQHGVPVFGAIIARNPRELVARFASVDKSHQHNVPNAYEHWETQLQLGDDVVSKVTYFDATDPGRLKAIFSEVETVMDLPPVAELDWEHAAEQLRAYV